MALWPHLHQVHLGSGAAAPGKLPGKLSISPIFLVTNTDMVSISANAILTHLYIEYLTASGSSLRIQKWLVFIKELFCQHLLSVARSTRCQRSNVLHYVQL